METKQMENEISILLRQLGFSNNGYEYYKQLLLLLLYEDIKIYCITDIYKKIALLFKATNTKVEHVLRYEITKITNNEKIFNLNNFFGAKVIFQKPPISEFVNVLAEYLREFKNCKTG